MALLDSVIAALLWLWLAETLVVAVVGVVAFARRVGADGMAVNGVERRPTGK